MEKKSQETIPQSGNDGDPSSPKAQPVININFDDIVIEVINRITNSNSVAINSVEAEEVTRLKARYAVLKNYYPKTWL
ncbi:hypothetical protein GO730_26095 [Spirosoma sp. HMF3257]|uniref:Uncharacterized protein n=1 Tax=Spirosoma telluris TaxID=2183553 RepID=A0A327NPV5_9BACT|nr:hypothetical protein [Spirosoma telluris]RAI76765.1 hypothetical protein HMF3257_26025 [Spirosoma telluris]